MERREREQAGEHEPRELRDAQTEQKAPGGVRREAVGTLAHLLVALGVFGAKARRVATGGSDPRRAARIAIGRGRVLRRLAAGVTPP